MNTCHLCQLPAVARIKGCSSRKKQNGLGLVESLVGLALGLIVALAIFQVYATWDGRQRTSVAKAEGLSQGALAAYLLERDLQQAGWGLSNVGGAANCALQGVTAFNAGGVVSPVLLPVQIRNLGSQDDLVVLYGNSQLRTLHANLVVGGTLGSLLTMEQRASGGFFVGDQVLLHDLGSNCWLGGPIAQVNNNTDQIGLGAPPPFTTGQRLLSMGPTPSLNQWFVGTQTGNNAAGETALFQRQHLLAGIPTRAMADGIVQLQAQYGVTDGAGGINWMPRNQTNTNLANPSFDWTTLVAIRFGIVSRSAQFEPPVNGVVVTPNQPKWAGGSFTLADIAALQGPPAAWQNYRYQVHEGGAALRNTTWAQGVQP